MDRSLLRFSLVELLLIAALLAILSAYAIQLHRREFHFPNGDRSLPWPILLVFAVWLVAWIGCRLRAIQCDVDKPSAVGMQGELLLAGSATAMITNGIVLILLSRSWSQGIGPDPIDTLAWLVTIVPVLAVGATATIFYRPMRHRILYWLLSLIILGAVCVYNAHAWAQTVASV